MDGFGVFAATHGLKTFDQYTDPETGKEGKTNVSVTVGAYRGNKLVSIWTALRYSICLCSERLCSACACPCVHVSTKPGCMRNYQFVVSKTNSDTNCPTLMP